MDGGSYDHDDVVRALVRLDRPQMRPGTSGQSGKTVPTYFTDPEVDAPTIVPGSESCTPQSMDRPHWNDAVDATLEDADFYEDGETTIARDGAVAIQCAFHITDDSQEEIEEDEVPQIFTLGTGLPEEVSILRRSPEVSLTPDEVQVTEIGDPA